MALSFFLFFVSYAQAAVVLDATDPISTGDAVPGVAEAVVYYDEEDAGTSSEPINVYVPFSTSVNPIATNVFEQNNVNGTKQTSPTTPTLSEISSTHSFSEPDEPYLKFTVYHNEGAERYFYLAVKQDDDTYDTVKIRSSVSGSEVDEIFVGNETLLELHVKWQDICDLTGCDLDNVAAESDKEEENTVFLFVSETDTLDNDISTDDYPGLFFNIQFEAKDYSDDIITNLTTRRGDTQAILTFDAGDINFGDDFLGLYLVYYGDQTDRAVRSIADAFAETNETIAEFTESFDLSGNTEITINDLVNNQTYNIAIYALNKFGFASQVSASATVTPSEIEAFLAQQSCFLLSASFQTDHYILDYFRNLRDHYLSSFSLGRVFVDWYYRTAPKYTEAILENPLLSWSIRSLAYGLYGFFKWGWVFLLGLLALGLEVRVFRYLSSRRISL